MTIEGPRGKRYLVHRDGSPVLPDDGPVRLDDLDPASRAIIDAILRARENAATSANPGVPTRRPGAPPRR